MAAHVKMGTYEKHGTRDRGSRTRRNTESIAEGAAEEPGTRLWSHIKLRARLGPVLGHCGAYRWISCKASSEAERQFAERGRGSSGEPEPLRVSISLPPSGHKGRDEPMRLSQQEKGQRQIGGAVRHSAALIGFLPLCHLDVHFVSPAPVKDASRARPAPTASMTRASLCRSAPCARRCRLAVYL